MVKVDYQWVAKTSFSRGQMCKAACSCTTQIISGSQVVLTKKQQTSTYISALLYSTTAVCALLAV
jgi:hypothetical protein